MAKQQQKQGHSNQNNNSGRRGSVAENTRLTEAGRERLRKQSKLRESRRNQERAEGTFYVRTNEGRSSDLFAAISGEVGLYAYPGVGQPSIHFLVEKVVGAYGAMEVIRIESIQEGHELNGLVYDSGVYLPCFYIQKFGASFQSRMSGLAKVTQETLCHYLVQELKDSFPTTETHDEIVSKANTNYKLLLEGVQGRYRVEREDGFAVFSVYPRKTAVVELVESSIPGLPASSAYLPVECLFKPSLEKVTADDVYAKQFAMYVFLRNELGPFIEARLAPKVPRSASGKPMGKKELAKQKARMAKERASATERSEEQTKIELMRRQCIAPSRAALGDLGYVNLSDLSGEFIILFGMVGADKVVQVAHMGDNHKLRLTGVDVGHKIYAGQVLAGRVDRVDAHHHKMSAKDIEQANALIGYVRTELEKRGVRIPVRKPANLALVA